MFAIIIGSVSVAPETGTLEHGHVNPVVSIGSGVPVALPAESETGTLEHRSQIAMFVSTCLASWPSDQPHVFARDVQINDTAYRRLDPEYYAWLRSKMTLAKMAAAAERLGQDEFDGLRSRFNAVHEWAMTHFGEQCLKIAIRDLDARDYVPPVPDLETPRRTVRIPASPAQDARTAVDALADYALDLGWKKERLYGCAGADLFSPTRGLVSFLKPGGRIGKVSLQNIELIGPPPDEVLQRFSNPDVDQPWIVRIRPSFEKTRKSDRAAEY
jgi:hypothetical protein